MLCGWESFPHVGYVRVQNRKQVLPALPSCVLLWIFALAAHVSLSHFIKSSGYSVTSSTTLCGSAWVRLSRVLSQMPMFLRLSL